MPSLWRAWVRFAAEWAALMLLGGALGIGAAEAVRAGRVSERSVLVGAGVLIAGAAAFVIWSGRDVDFFLWDDSDDDDPPDTPAA